MACDWCGKDPATVRGACATRFCDPECRQAWEAEVDRHIVARLTKGYVLHMRGSRGGGHVAVRARSEGGISVNKKDLHAECPGCFFEIGQHSLAQARECLAAWNAVDLEDPDGMLRRPSTSGAERGE